MKRTLFSAAATALILAISAPILPVLAQDPPVVPDAGSGGAVAPEWPEFAAYDMSGLSYMPATLREKGFEKIPVFFMCHIWNGDYGHIDTNCDGIDFSRLNREVIRQRAEESLGLPLVVIDIERTNNETTDVWHMLSEDPETVKGAVALWQELIATFREVNPDTRIMIYKPIPRIWWPLSKNRRYPLVNLGQAAIDARYRTAELIAPLFEDKTLQAWPSAYLTVKDPELMRDERQWQIRVCKELYRTRCVFALTHLYMKAKDENGRRIPVEPESMYRVIKELRQDGADGFGVWLPHHYDNPRYLERVETWEENGGGAAAEVDPLVGWLSGVDRYLSEP